MKPLQQRGTICPDRGQGQTSLMWKPERRRAIARRLPTHCYGCIRENGISGELHQKQEDRPPSDLGKLEDNRRFRSWVRLGPLERTEANQPDCSGDCQTRSSGTPCTVRYTVRMNYALHVEAVTASDAESKVAMLIRKEPQLAIRGVASEFETRKPLWRMFLFGT